MTERTEIGNYLKELRLLKNLSLREVESATKNSVSNAYLSQLESGEAKNPSPHILNQLAKVYDADYKELLTVAGHIKATSGSKKKTGGIAFFNKQDISKDEKEQLLDYLQYLRFKNRKKS